MKNTLVIATLVVSPFLLAACSSSGDTPQKVGDNTEASQTAENGSSAQTLTYAVGDQVESNGFVFTVNEVSRKQGGQFSTLKEGYEYIVPNVTIENQTDSETTISTLLQMHVKDTEGNKYDVALTTDDTGNIDGELLAGERVKGTVAFEVPQDAENLTLYYEPNWLGSGTIKVALDEQE